jgi:Uri superfamily endonuclease
LNTIKVVDMSDNYRPVGRDRRFFQRTTNLHWFYVDMFLSVIDRQLREVIDRFDEVNTELLLCISSFNPINSFAAYDKDNLVKLACFYPNDFSSTEMHHLPFQLNHFMQDMHRDE